MLLDAQLQLAANQNLAIAAPGAAQNLPPIDFMGAGVGNAPPNYFGVQNPVFGEDIGPGDGESPPSVLAIVGTAFVGAGATLTPQLQESVDSGPTGAPPYSPNAWQTISQGPALTAAELPANGFIRLPIPPRPQGQGLPRFFQVFWEVAGTFTAGTIASAQILTGRDDNTNTIYPANY